MPRQAIALIIIGAAGLAASAQPGAAQSADMSFFVTSHGSGEGANLGGLDGADRLCQTLAASVGAGGKTWRAYLSTQASGGSPPVNARDRIGRGPWVNAKGVVIARDVADLHGTSNNLTKATALTEKGDVVNGRGDDPNTHDILTGTQPDGTAFDESAAAKSWNASHASRGGCSVAALKSTGGAGLLYCFAAN
jgi:hypothetical protein